MAKKSELIVDPALLCDPSRQVVGRSPYDGVIIPFSDEELQQAEDESEEYSIAEILAGLEKE